MSKDQPSPVLRAGVIGFPIAQSRSPRLHGFWLDRYHISGSYQAIAVAPEDLEREVRAMLAAGFRGLNVTVPHKERVMDLCDQLDPTAQAIGAVNTLIFDKGRICGSNTDAYGFITNLVGGAPSWRAKTGPALVLGAGGAARAVIYALLDAGVPSVTLSNRNRARAEALAVGLSGFGRIQVEDWDQRSACLAGHSLLVNATSLGMIGKAALEVDLSALPPQALVTDLVYNPLETDLLASARARGNPVVDGLGMLLHQAVPGFAAWFGRRPEVTDALRRHVLAET